MTPSYNQNNLEHGLSPHSELIQDIVAYIGNEETNCAEDRKLSTEICVLDELANDAAKEAFLEGADSMLKQAISIYETTSNFKEDYQEELASCYYQRGHLLSLRTERAYRIVDMFSLLLPTKGQGNDNQIFKELVDRLTPVAYVNAQESIKEEGERLSKMALRMRRVYYATDKHPDVVECIIALLRLFINQPAKFHEVTHILPLTMSVNVDVSFFRH